VNVFLSYAVAPFDAAIPARLRAVAAAYDISIVLPDRSRLPPNGLPADIQNKIAQSDVVLALITSEAQPQLVASVNQELQLAGIIGRPIIALLEQGVAMHGIPNDRIVYFDRFQPTAHEPALIHALDQIKTQRQWKQSLTALGWIAGITLGLIALSKLASDEE